ncbi:hypothetical protein HanXRQr2_Chr13g0587751 [Helianthus annuus]|uniref:Uncharacterized protein n=1 Tax=Helianthus annuus TaxID=4232 RepID=A0A9K3EGS5_HELAN|nr:hypothetical protein HanXRQr2_Chr13g0587751 [Helianthus annuus]KAJ0849179.1 hypothetical protein HanPSC8_Chr13g0565931 [Helianthus annuus]
MHHIYPSLIPKFILSNPQSNILNHKICPAYKDSCRKSHASYLSLFNPKIHPFKSTIQQI